MRRFRRRRLFLLVPLLLLGVADWMAYRHARQARLDTALVTAVNSNDPGLIDRLLDRGANPNIRPVVPASTAQGMWLDALLVRGGGPATNPREPVGQTLLMLAAGRHRWGVVEVLVRHGADVNAKSDGGRTPLTAAAQAGNLAAVKTLVEHGANVNAGDGQSLTPLYHAAAYGAGHRDWRVAFLLLKRGADPNVKDHVRGNTPLFFATLSQDPDAVRPFLLHGADPTEPVDPAYGLAIARSAARTPALRRLLLQAEVDWRRTHAAPETQRR